MFIEDIVGIDFIPLFIFGSFMVVAFFAAKFRMPNIITISIFALYSIIISAFFPAVLAISLFLIGSIFAFALSKIIGNR